MKKNTRHRKNGEREESLLKIMGLLLAYFGWFWTVGIVLDERTPSYIRWAGLLLTVGSLLVYFEDNVKGKKIKNDDPF